MKKKFLSKLLICSLIMQSVFLFSDTTYFLNNTHVSAAIQAKAHLQVQPTPTTTFLKTIISTME